MIFGIILPQASKDLEIVIMCAPGESAQKQNKQENVLIKKKRHGLLGLFVVVFHALRVNGK